MQSSTDLSEVGQFEDHEYNINILHQIEAQSFIFKFREPKARLVVLVHPPAACGGSSTCARAFPNCSLGRVLLQYGGVRCNCIRHFAPNPTPQGQRQQSPNLVSRPRTRGDTIYEGALPETNHPRHYKTQAYHDTHMTWRSFEPIRPWPQLRFHCQVAKRPRP